MRVTGVGTIVAVENNDVFLAFFKAEGAGVAHSLKAVSAGIVGEGQHGFLYSIIIGKATACNGLFRGFYDIHFTNIRCPHVGAQHMLQGHLISTGAGRFDTNSKALAALTYAYT